MTGLRRCPRLWLMAGMALTLTPLVAPNVGAQICGDWTAVEPPSGATLAVTEVEARSSSEAFAFATPLGLIRWNGTEWSQFPVPIQDLNEWPTVWTDRFGLVGESHLFLAGRGSTGPFSSDVVLMIWDGSSWDHASITLQPNVGGAPRNGAATSVIGVAPDDVWIIGLASSDGGGINGRPILTVHWNGSELTEVLTPGVGDRQNNIYDAVAIASDDAWAVGTYNNTFQPDGFFRGMTYHFDGSSWTPIPNPTQSIAGSHLYAVEAISSDDVWAAGDGPDGPLFMHWDGSSWSIVPSPATTGTIYGLAAIASDDVWAVDYEWQVPVYGKYYHWDGFAWSVVAGPDVPGVVSVNRHGGLTAAGACDVWAVGSVQIGQSIQPYMEHLDATNVVAVPVVEPSVALLEASPNPLLRSVRIRSHIKGGVLTRARIFDSRGRLVRTLFDGLVSSDSFEWDGRNDNAQQVPGGVYFLRVESSDGQRHTQKLTVAR